MAKVAKKTSKEAKDLGWRRICELLGNGCFRRGKMIAQEIAMRVGEAREKHPDWAGAGPYYALGAIGAEYQEFQYAVEKESPERQHDEALDVVATCVRFLGGEHEKDS